MVKISNFIFKWAITNFGHLNSAPWEITNNAEKIIADAINDLVGNYRISEDVAIHSSATIEIGSIIKGPAIIGPDCYIAGTSYIRGGVFLEQECIIGPSCEIKTTFMFSGSKAAHLNFVGDSIVGEKVNIEAGAIIANYRNEMENKNILIQANQGIIDTGVDKFGALVGDGVRIGANSVIAPGALIEPNFLLGRLKEIDQHPLDQS